MSWELFVKNKIKKIMIRKDNAGEDVFGKLCFLWVLKYYCTGWDIPVNLGKSESQKRTVVRCSCGEAVNPGSFFLRSKLPGTAYTGGINFH